MELVAVLALWLIVTSKHFGRECADVWFAFKTRMEELEKGGE